MHLNTYLELLQTSQRALADSYATVAPAHGDDSEVLYTCRRFAEVCVSCAQALDPVRARYEGSSGPEPARLRPVGMGSHREGAVGLLRDLQELDQLANLVQTTLTLVGQAAHAVRDRELIELTAAGERDIAAQLAWLRARMRSLAPQALIAAH